MKAKISLILRVVISVGMVIFLLRGMSPNFAHIAATLAKTNPALFAFGAMLYIINIGTILSLRLSLLFAAEGLAIPLVRVVQLSYIGYFFNNFMPTAVGGDIVKAYYAYKQTNQAAKSFVSVFMDRFIGLFSFICIAVAALFLSWGNIEPSLKKIILLFALLLIIAFLIILNSRIAKVVLKALSTLKLWNVGERLSKVYRAVHEYRNKKSIIFAVIALSVIAQSIYFLTVYLLARALGTGLLPMTVFLLMPIVSAVSMLPSVGGLGLREGAIVVLFSPFIGASAFSLSILLLAVLFIVSMVGAAIYATASQFRIKRNDISTFNKYSV